MHQTICHLQSKQHNATVHLAVMVRRMLGHRASQLSHLDLLRQVALQTRKHHLTLARLET